jgi:hypothetical protein
VYDLIGNLLLLLLFILFIYFLARGVDNIDLHVHRWSVLSNYVGALHEVSTLPSMSSPCSANRKASPSVASTTSAFRCLDLVFEGGWYLAARSVCSGEPSGDIGEGAKASRVVNGFAAVAVERGLSGDSDPV